MTKQAAEKVVKILMECDGGCNQCTAHVIALFIKEFPEYRDMAVQAWEAEFKDMFGEWQDD